MLLRQHGVAENHIGEKLADNIAAVDATLSADEIRKLDAVSELPPEYPGWMLSTQGAD